jgi:hypothetical protein
LGINNFSNERIIKDLSSINEGLVSGGPVLEVHQKCPEKVCRKVVKVEEKECPGPRVKNVVKEIYVDRCEGNKIECILNIVYLPKVCNMNTCLDITAEYCNGILKSTESE